jgi:diadenylate cyclase
MGMAEETDAVLLVISEETGNISVARQNELYQNLAGDQLHSLLTRLLVGVPRATWLGRLRGMFANRKA